MSDGPKKALLIQPDDGLLVIEVELNDEPLFQLGALALDGNSSHETRSPTH